MPTGLYVHTPFCETKCGYCDFYSVPLKDRATSPLVHALLQELNLRQSSVSGPFTTIFVGGGTPTLLPMEDLRELFGRLGTIARRDGVGEFTTEANPATVDHPKVELLTAAGVNRMSFGAQSFHQRELDVLERLHNPDDIGPAIQIARQGGITNINLDLIFGIPGQTLDSWRDSLRQALDLETDHLSCYGLTYEPQTPLTAQLNQGLITPCDNDIEADMYLLCIEVLASHGFVQYEISNFARPGRECRHNLIYWHNWPYLGIGPSAASYVDGARFKNIPHIESYVRDMEAGRPAWREEERLTGNALAGEIVMLQLRLNRGLDLAEFKSRTGLDALQLYAGQIAEHTSDRLLERDDRYLRLTDGGRLLADRIIADFILADRPSRLPLQVL